MPHYNYEWWKVMLSVSQTITNLFHGRYKIYIEKNQYLVTMVLCKQNCLMCQSSFIPMPYWPPTKHVIINMACASVCLSVCVWLAGWLAASLSVSVPDCPSLCVSVCTSVSVVSSIMDKR